MNNPNKANVAIKWALIGLIASIILTFLWQFLNLGVTSPVRYVGYAFFIFFLFMAQKEYRDKLGGFVSYGDAFLTGLLFSVFSGILLAIFMFIYYDILNPAAYQQILDAQRTAMEAKNLSADQVDQAMGMMTKYGVAFTIGGILIGTIIVGAIIALIGAAIFKKERTLQDIERERESTDPAV